MKKQVIIREGDRLWPLMELISDTHIDDLPDHRLRQVEELIDSWRITDPNGRLLSKSGV